MTITQQELETRLWDAANSLRGPVDPSDSKAYMFLLLFFKRLSAAWDEEHQMAVDEFGNDVDDNQYTGALCKTAASQPACSLDTRCHIRLGVYPRKTVSPTWEP